MTTANGVGRPDLRHPHRHLVEEEPLDVLPRGAGLARRHVRADRGEQLAADVEVRLDPPPGQVDRAVAEPAPHRDGLGPARDRDPRAALRHRLVVDDVPARQRDREVVGGGPHLLERDDVDVRGIEPFAHAVADRRPDSVDVDRGEANAMWHACQPIDRP